MFKSTRFSELLKAFPRRAFNRIVDQEEADKHCKGFSSYDHLTAMIFSQLSGSQSLREVETGFNSQSSHHYHLGSSGKVKRSTLSDANNRRSPAVFEKICQHLMQNAHKKLKNELNDLLYLIDSSGIRLAGQGFDGWTQTTERHRIHGLKLHTIYSPQAQVPIRVDITGAQVQDVEMRKALTIEKGAIYAFDKGYYDYNWWHEIDQQGAYFVTRFKKNAAVKTLQTKPVSEQGEGVILEDSMVEFKKLYGKRRQNHYQNTPLRKIVVHREDKSTPITLATNDFERSAEEIAQIYKKRWAIEMFFKWIKQHLKVKKYLGRSENAVKTQIYIALITYLLVKTAHELKGSTQSLKMFLIELRSTLFSRSESDRYYERRRRKEDQELAKLQVRMAI